MPKNSESLNRSLFNLLHSKGFDPTMLDTSGKEIPTPEEAEVFQFNFIKDGEDYGKVTISIDGLHKLCVYFSDEVANSEKEETHGEDESWYKVLNQLKRFAQKYQLSFELKNIDHLKHDMAKREYMKKQERISEGYYPMGKKASYNDAVPNVKIVIQHTRQIEEGEQRYRNIAKIFLENSEGERFLAPTIKPGVARVYGRLIAEGDKPHGERWNHVTSLVEEYQKMGAFVRATRNGQFNESAQRLVNEGINHYQGLRETLSRMTGHRGYNTYFESWTPSLMEEESEENNLNELFVQETLDPRIESVMPILNKLQKKVAEMKEVGELSEWADSLTEAPGAETLGHNVRTDAKNLKAFDLEESEDDIDDPVVSSITRRIIRQHPELLKHGPDKVLAAIADVADFVGDVEEIGSSDVSGWVKQVARKLGGEGMDEAVRAGFVTPDWMKTPQQGAYGAPTDQLGRPYNQDQRDKLAAAVKQNRKDNKAFSGGLPTKGADSAAFGWDGVWKAPEVKYTAVRAQQDKAVAPTVHKTYDRTEPADSKKWKTLASAGDGKGIADEGMFDKVTDAVKKFGGKVLDKLGHGSDEELLKKIQKDVGAPAGSQHGKPSMAKPNDDSDIIEDDIDESALQASFGIKKYGKKGMDKLRAAGKKHASEKTMQNIRAEFSDKEKPVKEGNGDTEIHPGMKVSQGTVVKVNGNTVTVKTSNGDMMNMNIHDVDQAVKEGQEELDAMMRLLGEGWKGELAGGTLGGVSGTVAGSALGALAGGPVGAAIGGVVGGAAGGTAGQMAGRELTKEEQLNEVAPLLAAGARAIMPLLAKVGPKLGQMASGAGKAGAEVAGKTATGIGRGTVDVAKSAAGSAAQNAGQIGVGVGAYQAITDVADKMVGGVGEVYRDVGKAAGAIAQSVGDAIDGKTIAELASAAVKYSIPIGIILAVLYGGKKLIDQVMSEGADDSEMGALGKMVGSVTPNPSDFAQGFKKTFEGQDDLDTIRRLLKK
jgi:hypothetical protein